MRYHVPFAHRRRPPGRRNAGPIYIGFDEPVSIQKRKQPFNWCGFMGLMLALVSPLTLLLSAPFALLFSVVGLRRGPRGMAVIGLVLSLIATSVLSLLILGYSANERFERGRHAAIVNARENRQMIRATQVALDEAKKEVREYRSSNNNYIPTLREGNDITVQHLDAWDESLAYGVNSDGCIIRSKGPDREMHTADDITIELAGKQSEITVD